MKKTHKKILAVLRNNSRERIKNISRKVGKEIDEITHFLKGNSHCITKYTALLDYAKLGYDVRVFFVLSISKKEKEEVLRYLSYHDSVNSLFKINNGFDFMVECVFKNMKECNSFLEAFEARFLVYRKEDYFILDSLREQKFLSNPNLVF
jgi:DNA-binding Lrp family transcriptional regulator